MRSCPKCGGKEVLPLVYGKKGDQSKSIQKKIENGEILLVSREPAGSPNLACRSCGFKWRAGMLPLKYLKKVRFRLDELAEDGTKLGDRIIDIYPEGQVKYYCHIGTDTKVSVAISGQVYKKSVNELLKKLEEMKRMDRSFSQDPGGRWFCNLQMVYEGGDRFSQDGDDTARTIWNSIMDVATADREIKKELEKPLGSALSPEPVQSDGAGQESAAEESAERAIENADAPNPVSRVPFIKTEVCGYEVHIPEEYRKLNSLPEDPAGSAAYGFQNENCSCFVLFSTVAKEKAMPFGDIMSVSRGIHQHLSEQQGVVEIQSLRTAAGNEYTYTIVKTGKEPSGVQYTLTLHIDQPEEVLQVQGFFEEQGTTGLRDTFGYEAAVRNGLVKAGSFEGWAEDPYDPDYRKGLLRNLSENEELDSQFPSHPLSVLRGFLKMLLNQGQDEYEDPGRALKTAGIDLKAVEDAVNDILPGLSMYVRDLDLDRNCEAAYQPGSIIMERGFTDASFRVMGMKTSHRISILSNHMADFGDFEHDTGWGLFVANHHSHFKVLDVFKYRGKTQILLLHLPDDERWRAFQNITLSLEKKMIEDCRQRFKNKCLQEIVPELAGEDWLDRCRNPIGMDEQGRLFDINELPGELSENVKQVDYHITVRLIMGKLTGEAEKDIAFLKAQMEKYKDHPMGSEIIKACARKLFDLLPEDQKKKLGSVIDNEQDLLRERLDNARRLMLENKPEEAKQLIDSLAGEADEYPMFREDNVSQFFLFREWFEEYLYRVMYQPRKEVRRAEYPFDEIYALQGSMYIDLKDLGKAREALKKALSWNPLNTQNAFEYAETFKIEGNMETFLEETRRIQKFAIHSKDVARFLRNIGYYFIETGQPEEAMMCYARSLLYDRESLNATDEINVLHKVYKIEPAMPDAVACRTFSEKYGFSLGADEFVLGQMYNCGKHFQETNETDGAKYCFSLLYDLTEDPHIKEILDALPGEN